MFYYSYITVPRSGCFLFFSFPPSFFPSDVLEGKSENR